MNWDDLRIFLEASREPRLDVVAAKLRMDPTTVSRRLKRLEADLDVTLFERTRRGHILTRIGELYVEFAESMESAAYNLTERDQLKGVEVSGHIRLGVTEGLGTAFLAPKLPDFTVIHPSVTLDLIALSGFVSVPKREADMSILLSRPQAGRLKVRKLTDYELGLYSSTKYIESRSKIRAIEDLKNHTLIGYVDDLIYSPKLRYLHEVEKGISLRLASSSIVAQQAMIAAGAGVGILPRFMAKRHDDLIEVLQSQVTLRRAFWLVIHENVSHFSRIRAMSDFLADTFNKARDLFLS